ncbi:hypothetical protein ABPG74_004031 [Tetrahymena malaccensis]
MKNVPKTNKYMQNCHDLLAKKKSKYETDYEREDEVPSKIYEDPLIDNCPTADKKYQSQLEVSCTPSKEVSVCLSGVQAITLAFLQKLKCLRKTKHLWMSSLLRRT